jgi:hypothetical protein
MFVKNKLHSWQGWPLERVFARLLCYLNLIESIKNRVINSFILLPLCLVKNVCPPLTMVVESKWQQLPQEVYQLLEMHVNLQWW